MGRTDAPVTDGSLRFVGRGNGLITQYSGPDADITDLNPETWPTWRKTSITRAARLPGPFTVETSEGPLRCEDGWLAVDARGYPYPIAADEFDLIYESAGLAPRALDPLDAPAPERHPAVAALLAFFAYEHLPAGLQVISRPFSELAQRIADGPQNAEATTGLRKLLEAKDCAVRAALPAR